MAKKRKRDLPAELYVYIGGYVVESGRPVYVSTTNLNDINDGTLVGCYSQVAVMKLAVTRELVNVQS